MYVSIDLGNPDHTIDKESRSFVGIQLRHRIGIILGTYNNDIANLDVVPAGQGRSYRTDI